MQDASREALAEVLRVARERGEIAERHDPHTVAAFLVTFLNGLLVSAKITPDPAALEPSSTSPWPRSTDGLRRPAGRLPCPDSVTNAQKTNAQENERPGKRTPKKPEEPMMYDHDGAPLRTGRAAVNGTSLHYRTAGSGPAVVLLHGVPKTGYHWRHLVPKLTPHHTVVVPDLRGLGDSARPADGYDSATMSDDVAELMARLGHETYAVTGEDWGAVIGYQLAARHRDRVTSLVFAEALFPGFGFEDHTALTPENVSGMHLWHLGFYFTPDVPEMLIAGTNAN